MLDFASRLSEIAYTTRLSFYKLYCRRGILLSVSFCPLFAITDVPHVPHVPGVFFDVPAVPGLLKF